MGVGPSLRCVAEVDDVAILHDVLLAFEPEFRVFLARAERPALQQYLARDDFRADEPALDVAVYFSCRQLSVRPARNRPRAVFIFAHREERNVAEQIVT